MAPLVPPFRRAGEATRRLVVVLAITALGGTLAACGGGTSAEPGAARLAEAEPAPAVPPSTTVAPATSITSTTTTRRPLAPHEVLVADVKAEVGELAVFDAPDGARYVPELALINPWYFDGPLSLLVMQGRETDAWVEVQLPTRPNDTRKWIRSADVTFRTHRFQVTVDVGDRVVRAYDAGVQVFETPVVVGRPGTPTPLGRFFINANIPQRNPAGAYGPVILSVSSFSEVLETFDGGLPAIALHGTPQPGLVGQAMSNGCIRMPNEAILELAALLPLGTPVEFVA